MDCCIIVLCHVLRYWLMARSDVRDCDCARTETEASPHHPLWVVVVYRCGLPTDKPIARSIIQVSDKEEPMKGSANDGATEVNWAAKTLRRAGARLSDTRRTHGSKLVGRRRKVTLTIAWL